MEADTEKLPLICLRKIRHSQGMRIETEVYFNTATHTILESIVLSADRGLPQHNKDDVSCASYSLD